MLLREVNEPNGTCRWCELTEDEKKYLLFETVYWRVYLADKQDYIGRCVLVLARHCHSLSELEQAEWIELKSVVDRLESAITLSLGAAMFNWSCLMNDFYKADSPDPHLHIHVRPRYKAPVVINGKEYSDEEYGHHYDNHKPNRLTEAETEAVYRLVKEALA